MLNDISGHYLQLERRNRNQLLQRRQQPTSQSVLIHFQRYFEMMLPFYSVTGLPYLQYAQKDPIENNNKDVFSIVSETQICIHKLLS